MVLDQSLKALHDDGSEHDGAVVILLSSVTLAFLGTGTMVALLKHVGTADWDRD